MILEANLTAAAMLDALRSALVNQPISQFILKDDQDAYYQYRKHLFETDKSQVCELRMVKKDGTLFWAHLEATAAQDADGKPVCRVIVSDVSERKRSDKELKAKLYEIERMNTCMLGREDRVMELKKEVNTLLKAAGKPETYPGGC